MKRRWRSPPATSRSWERWRTRCGSFPAGGPRPSACMRRPRNSPRNRLRSIPWTPRSSHSSATTAAGSGTRRAPHAHSPVRRRCGQTTCTCSTSSRWRRPIAGTKRRRALPSGGRSATAIRASCSRLILFSSGSWPQGEAEGQRGSCYNGAHNRGEPTGRVVMDAGDLEIGFRLGDWVLEPRLGRISRNGHSHALALHHVRILRLLAERHGEVVERWLLRENAWPDQHSTDDMLRAAIRELREILGDSSRDPRYIVRVSRRGYALIAHFETLAQPSRALLAVDPDSVVVESRLIARAQKLVSELRRRSVLKVLGAYLLGMWIMLQVAQTTFEPLRLPGWWMTALTILAVIGIPIVGSARLGLRDHAGRNRARCGRHGPSAPAACAPGHGAAAGDRRRVDGERDRARLVEVDSRGGQAVSRGRRACRALDRRAAARGHDPGRWQCVPRRRLRRGNLLASWRGFPGCVSPPTPPRSSSRTGTWTSAASARRLASIMSWRGASGATVTIFASRCS